MFVFILACCNRLVICMFEVEFRSFDLNSMTSSDSSAICDYFLGSSPVFLMSLFVMCIAACLAGTVLMIFKKSRENPSGYALLVSGDLK